MPPLFKTFPGLQKVLPHERLGKFPTPVQKLSELGRELSVGRLYIKRDDLCGNPYGGNKVRKLEFLLANALRHGRPGVLTFGCAGSNHALATTVYAQKLDLERISMLLPQPNAHSVRHNLLLAHKAGAEMHYIEKEQQLGPKTEEIIKSFKRRFGRGPEVIPPGGSSTLGTAGFVNAAFELRQQIRKGELPEPDFIYVASGTMGTSAGLLLGCRIAGIKSRVLPVRVTDLGFSNVEKMSRLVNQTAQLLHSLDGGFPALEFSPADIKMEHGFFGKQYAEYTEESVEAVRCLKQRAGVKLEGTYTGKTLAALMAHARRRNLKNTVVLFWNTYNSWDFSALIKNLDYRELPNPLHRYFTDSVQPLDKMV